MRKKTNETDHVCYRCGSLLFQECYGEHSLVHEEFFCSTPECGVWCEDPRQICAGECCCITDAELYAAAKNFCDLVHFHVREESIRGLDQIFRAGRLDLILSYCRARIARASRSGESADHRWWSTFQDFIGQFPMDAWQRLFYYVAAENRYRGVA